MELDRRQIETRIPHSGSMCLLDRMIACHPDFIECAAAAPEATHPLAGANGVPAVVAVEYAAQATALHGALTSVDEQRGRGFLAKLSDVSFAPHAGAILCGPLRIQARLQSRSDQGCLYSFRVMAGSDVEATGTLIVALEKDSLS